MTIKVGVMPGKVEKIIVSNGSTVADALKAAEPYFGSPNAITDALGGSKSYLVKLDGEVADLTQVLDEDHSFIIVARATKGN